MYLDYWQLQRKPFENTPDPEFYYFSPAHKDAFIRFKYALAENKGAILLTGDYGCGKTTLIRLLISDLKRSGKFRFALVNTPRGDGCELLKSILTELGVAEVPETLREAERAVGEALVEGFQAGLTTVVIVDESQLIQDQDALEELRLLLNYQLSDRFLINLFLVGQPEFSLAIDLMPQLKQRFFTRYHLGPLSLVDTRQYIAHRLKVAGNPNPIFDDGAIELIWEQSEGVPRRINNICDLSLLFGASARRKKVSREIIEKAL